MKRLLGLILTLAAGSSLAFGQTLVTGDLAGRVTDPTGAAIPGAKVTLKSLDEGSVQTDTTNKEGAFRFPLLRPGSYSVHEEGFGMKSDAIVAVNVGQATTLNLQSKPNGGETVVEVTGEPLLQREDANISTTFSQNQVESLPIPGGDLTNLPFSTPGVNIATGDDYGNFTVFGISGDSNLFTTNGSDIMDAYDNLAATGSSNNALGANEVSEAAVVVNGYTGQYGKLAGAQVNFTTKAGTNKFHGNAIFYYNSSGFNANDWFLKKGEIQGGTLNAQPHAVSNQWGGSVGGPIWKDKLFFFFDDEGLRYALPAAGKTVYIPSVAFQNATLANIATTQPAELAFYKNVFNVYNGAAGASTAIAATSNNTGGSITDGGCGAAAGIVYGGATLGAATPCASFFSQNGNSVNTEQLYTIRVDVNLGAKDQFNARYKHDWGLQATSTDPINPAFSANSNQPEYEGQFNETHIFSPNLVNSFTGATSYYDAVFGPPNLGAALALVPTTYNFADGAGFFSLGNGLTSYPSGRDVSVYQFSDDLSITKGRHNIKVGYNFRRDNITYISTQANKNGSTTFASNLDFYNGLITKNGGSTTNQAFPFVTPAHENFYSISVYAQDQVALTPKFKLTASLRFDRFGDPACGANCFVRTNGPFDSLTHSTTANQLPYTQAILTNQRNAFQGTEAVTIQPRMGFAYSPFGPNGKTVIRGGGGLFADLPVDALVGRFTTAAPNVATFTITPNTTNPSYTVVPGLTGSSYAAASASAAAFRNGFYSGATLPAIQAAVVAAGSTYSAPTYSASGPNTLLNPKYAEYNLEVQQAITRHDSIDINYVGNYGFDILFFNPTVNAYASCYPTICPTGFPGLPNAQVDNRFTSVSEITNNGHSNYNGVVTSYKHLGANGLTTTLNYTFGHALDNTSNGGYLPDQGFVTAVQTQIDPTSPDRLNYGNADYDNRHNFSGNVVYTPPVKFHNEIMQSALGGWTVSATMFAKSGVPYTVVRGSLASYFTSSTNGGSVLGAYLGGPRAPCNNPRTTCLTLSQFAANSTATRTQQIAYGFGNLARNSFRGPGYFDSDMQISKTTTITEGVKFKFGANIFNVLNHPNFAPPNNNIATGSTFGTITADLPPVSSPYGNFEGAGVSGRIIQVQGGFTF